MPRKYSKGAQEKVEKAMHERKHGTLKSGGSGKKVTSRKQAIAIGLSEARERGEKVPAKKSASKKAATRKKAATKKSATSKKSASKKAAPRKKTAAKKSAGRKKTAARKPAARKRTATKKRTTARRKSS